VCSSWLLTILRLKSALIIALILVLTTTSMLNAPRPLAAATSRPLPAGSWWSVSGAYRQVASGSGSDKGTFTETGEFTHKFTVTNKDSNTMTLLRRLDGSSSCVATENLRCNQPSDTYSRTYEYTIALDSLTVTGVGKDASTDLIGHPFRYVVNVGQLAEGSKIPHTWWVPDGNAKGSTVTDVSYNVGTERTDLNGIQTRVWSLTYSGDTLGFWRNGDGVYSRGPLTETNLHDPVYGIWVGWRYSFTADGVEVGGRGSWTEEYSEETQFEDTSLSFTAQVSVNVEPSAHVAVVVDGVKYASDRLPAVFNWDIGTTHSLKVDETVEGDDGVRYVFVQWSDGSKDASRTLTSGEQTSLTATFKTQYELVVVSDFGDPQGAGWYDDGTEAAVSVDSPVPDAGLLGSLGAKKVFQEWTGDLTSDSRTETIRMDGPKTVEAKWTTDSSQAYLVLGGIAGAIIAVLAFVLLSKHRGQPTLKAAPPAPRIVTRPPAPRPPPATAYAPPPPSQAAVKYCVHCGATIPSVVQYCTECGRKQ